METPKFWVSLVLVPTPQLCFQKTSPLTESSAAQCPAARRVAERGSGVPPCIIKRNGCAKIFREKTKKEFTTTVATKA